MRVSITIIVLCCLAVFFLWQPVMAQEKQTPTSAPTEAIEKTASETGEEISKSKLEIKKFACGTAVEERELQGEATTFPSDIERIYCWSLITGCEEPTTVEHVWYYGNKEIARVPLDVKYPRMRTWSYKTMMPQWIGDWKVELVDIDGQVLATSLFKVE
jgi:hypothetical protein